MTRPREVRLAGGSNGGAVLVDGTVRRPAGAGTPAVHALLRHLEAVGFDGAPRALGVDAEGREVLSYLPGETVGDSRPWPAWARSEEALAGAGRWLRAYHDAVRGFVPPPDAHWYGDHDDLRPGELIGHHDAGPYNAVWRQEDRSLAGFVDWDLAGPMQPIRDLAFVAISWVPLLPDARAVADGFAPGSDRAGRLRRLLTAARFDGGTADVLDAAVRRADEHAAGLRAAAIDGYAPAARLVAAGAAAEFDAVRQVVDALR